MMKSLKDLIGPIRSNKSERNLQTKRIRNREKELHKLRLNYGPDKSLILKYRQGVLKKSSINKMPLTPIKPLVSNEINVFKKNNNYFHPGKTKIMGKENK
jgi:uncharacterized protein (UPF0305 family)